MKVPFQKAVGFVTAMKREISLHRIVAPVLSIAVFLLVIKDFGHNEIVVLSPPTLSKDVAINKDGKSEDFSVVWGMFFAGLLGNMTPATVDAVRQNIGAYLGPDDYDDIMSEMSVEAENIKRDRVSQSFEFKDVRYERATNKTFVSGYRVRHGLTGQADRQSRTFEMEITIKNYRPLLLMITSYGGEPKLQSAIAQEKARAEAAKKHSEREEGDN